MRYPEIALSLSYLHEPTLEIVQELRLQPPSRNPFASKCANGNLDAAL